MPSLYEVTIPPFIKNLKILSTLLEKGVAHANGNDATLLEARLIADMQPLTYQIQRVSDTSKGLAVRLGKAAPVSWEDNEKTFPELQERLSKTIKFLEALDSKCMDGLEDAEVVMKTRSGEQKFTGLSYVNSFAIPNFYFHFVTAYGILRKEGVQIGKNDYLGRN
jgi:hypothetical protein